MKILSLSCRAKRNQLRIRSGISGAKKLVDNLEVHTDPKTGTKVILTKKSCLNQTLSQNDLAELSARLAKISGESSYDELRQQNEDLINMLDLINKQNATLEKANSELLKQTLIFGTISDAIVITDLNDKIIDVKPCSRKDVWLYEG